MSEKRRICVVVASRANYGRIKSVLNAIKKHPQLELQLIVGASALLHRFGNVIDVIRKDGFEPSATVYSIVEGENPTTMAKSTGMGILELATQFENLRPHVVLTVADRFETMATAIAASYMNIPLAHTQGGEVTGSIDESVRHAITKLSHIHFPATKLSAERLVKMGEEPERIKLTGCPAIDAISDMDLSNTPDLFKRYGGVGPELDPKNPYIVVLQHPVTTEYGQGFDQINETLKAVKKLRRPTVWLWPNVDAGSDDISKGLRVFREKERPEYIHFFRNFSVEDYAKLINNSECLIGNSSSGIREGSFLGVPVVNVGTRQTNRERGENVIDATYNSEDIFQKAKSQIEHGRYKKSNLFGDGQAGVRIAGYLAEMSLKNLQKRLTY
ncbi:MAG: UDP-N-acetylglucosamine 2-epimerase (hydrolyzing) [Oligoflexia bacterium]|nr:UDP-N-acetylglucosamine 2-epimerase (hydrolyzing) [Oligoflexia bacterium]